MLEKHARLCYRQSKCTRLLEANFSFFLLFRECQVANWSKHKKACDLLHESLQKIKEQEKKSSS